MDAKKLSFEEIEVNMEDKFEKQITENDVLDFARLTGDYNPIHTDQNYASHTKFGERIIHGMFIASLFSTFVGMYLPGRNCLYLSQEVQFKNPVKIGDNIEIYGKVTKKLNNRRILFMELTAKVNKKVAVKGKAQVMVL